MTAPPGQVPDPTPPVPLTDDEAATRFATSLRVLADALCHTVGGCDPMRHYRGVEGVNGRACDIHQRQAAALLADIRRIEGKIAERGNRLPTK